MKTFKSDNVSGVHPKILKAIQDANRAHEDPYGEDVYTKNAIESIRGLFEKDVDVYFMLTGTSANIVGLSAILKSFEGIVCTETAHINTDECGAFERFCGCKILYTKSNNGKLKIDDIKGFLNHKNDEHRVQPKVISISQTTETGTLYSVDEIKVLADFAHEHDMYLHLDGARIANAVVALDSSFKEMITDTGVDLLSFGGTKNGMMIGEAIVSFNKKTSKDLKYHRKQGMQLVSKMRFMSCQFIPYIEDEIWRECANHANEMGQYLKNSLKKCKGITVKDELNTNMIFAYMDKSISNDLQEKIGFNIIDEETNLARLVTSFDTEKEEIDNFIQAIEKII